MVRPSHSAAGLSLNSKVPQDFPRQRCVEIIGGMNAALQGSEGAMKIRFLYRHKPRHGFPRFDDDDLLAGGSLLARLDR